MFKFMKFKIARNKIEPLEIGGPDNFRERSPMLIVSNGAIKRLIFGNIKFRLISE